MASLYVYVVIVLVMLPMVILAILHKMQVLFYPSLTFQMLYQMFQTIAIFNFKGFLIL